MTEPQAQAQAQSAENLIAEKNNNSFTISENKVVISCYALLAITPILWITPFIAVIIAYIQRKESEDWVKTHYKNIIRTFWIGLIGSTLFGVFFALTFMLTLYGAGVLNFIAYPLFFAFMGYTYYRIIKGAIYSLKIRAMP